MPMGDEESDSEMSPMLRQLASKLGFDGDKADALKEFVHECMVSGYDTEAPTGGLDMGGSGDAGLPL